MSNNQEHTDLVGLDLKTLTFTPAEECNVANTTITYKKIKVRTLYSDGSRGDLVFPTEKLFSTGVKESRDFNDNTKINGYTIPLFLWDKDGATPEQVAWTEKFDELCSLLKDHVYDVRDELERYELEKSELKKMNPLSWQTVKGKRIQGKGPSFFAKLLTKKQENGDLEIKTLFSDEEGNPLDPMEDLMGKFCKPRAAIRLDYIYVGGSVISPQFRVTEVMAEVLDKGPRRMLLKAPVRPVLQADPQDTGAGGAGGFSSDEEDDDSSEDDDEEGTTRKRVKNEAP